ncbi:hypothetical protein KDL01_10080 [Actinospica durhamensis]|uniref:Peptidase n=1 Tax=Actinospica durhamensis TaxID=1508375 RepID=A0A941ETK2_9ACTN|nr:hypothetical protein [Actinospica durhamensis]MBR7833614.1 hypothetical protein [Actinospica durhamensis]
MTVFNNARGELASRAIHEAGHAAAFIALGWELDYVTLSFDGSGRGRTVPVDPYLGTIGQRRLVAAAGVIAGLQQNGWRVTNRGAIDIFCGSADNRFEVCGLRSGSMNRIDRGSLVGRPDEDLYAFAVEGAEEPVAPEDAASIWNACGAFVASVLSAVVAIAYGLLESREITLAGSAATGLYTAAMRGRPPALLPAWATVL